MENNEKPYLKWCEKLRNLRNGTLALEEIPEDEQALYISEYGDIRYNWDGIYCALFGKTKNGITIPRCPIPDGMRELFEVDEKGRPTGSYNWDYAIDIIESIAESSIYDMWNTEHSEEINDMLFAMPSHVSLVLSNIDNPQELHEILVASQKADLNCPRQIRENPETIYSLFEMSEEVEDLWSCFDLMGDSLIGDKHFLQTLLEIPQIKENPYLMQRINDEINKTTESELPEEKRLAIQDSAVMLAMKDAVRKTIGRTSDAEIDLKTPTKDEKEYEGEDYGDN